LNLCQLVLTVFFRCDGAPNVGRPTQEQHQQTSSDFLARLSYLADVGRRVRGS
jgi:hypothetical protein